MARAHTIVDNLSKLTPEQRLAASKTALLARWGTDRERCACKVMTLKRAQTRGRSDAHQPFCTFYKPERRPYSR